ncbi:MAG: lipoprotein [Bacteroidetes bacterium OLB12]|nr:MAG: lipoprotein [Bacteroidetes bacterium OLB12]HNU42288.1 LysM peptidoglycan-binding domain-containing protein [Cyclobacteriaceae bacterium]
MIKVIFLTLATWGTPGQAKATPVDSLRLETIAGKQFIIHQIDEKETLYAISRRYGVPITSILEHNPTADGGLAVGQLLKVPYIPKAKSTVVAGGDKIHKVAAKETLFSISRLYDVSVDEIKTWNNLKDNALSLGQELVIKKKAAATTTLPATQSMKGVHTVAGKETLYSIARQYNISVQQLREWNSLTADEVKIGQTLFVTQPMYQKPEIKTQPEVVVKPEVKEEPAVTIVKPETKTQPEIKETTIRISENVAGTDEVKEGGLAELIEGTDGNRKYLALHRTAKVGTILKVRNELNNREVFVRVAGPLPNIGANSNVILKISKSAYDRLGAIDPRFRVEVTYYK